MNVRISTGIITAALVSMLLMDSFIILLWWEIKQIYKLRGSPIYKYVIWVFNTIYVNCNFITILCCTATSSHTLSTFHFHGDLTKVKEPFSFNDQCLMKNEPTLFPTTFEPNNLGPRSVNFTCLCHPLLPYKELISLSFFEIIFPWRTTLIFEQKA